MYVCTTDYEKFMLGSCIYVNLVTGFLRSKTPITFTPRTVGTFYAEMLIVKLLLIMFSLNLHLCMLYRHTYLNISPVQIDTETLTDRGKLI